MGNEYQKRRVHIGLNNFSFNIFQSCEVIKLNSTECEFYTDANFEKFVDGKGEWNVRKFMKDSFQDVNIAQRHQKPIRICNSWMEIEEGRHAMGKFQDLEYSIDAYQN